MAFDSRDERASAQGFFLWPLHPEPDGIDLSKSDRRMMIGVYSGLILDDPIGGVPGAGATRFSRRIWRYRERYNYEEPYPY